MVFLDCKKIMDDGGNQNLAIVKTDDINHIKELIIGFHNTFGGYIAIPSRIAVDSKQISCFCSEMDIANDEISCGGWKLFLIENRTEKLRQPPPNFLSLNEKQIFRLKNMLVYESNNIVGINEKIFKCIRHTDLVDSDMDSEGLIRFILNNSTSPDEKFIRHYITLTAYQENLVEFFLTTNLDRRYECSKQIISNLWERHGKQVLYLEFLDKLGDYEIGARYFKKTHRDHVTHQAYVYFLGLFLSANAKVLSLDSGKRIESAEEYYKDEKFSWRLASTFHDIAYPFQIFSEEMNSYFNLLNDKIEKTDFYLPLNIKDDLYSIQIKRESIPELIEKKTGRNIYKYFKKRSKKGRSTNGQKVSCGYLDHGFMGAVLFLKLTDYLYKKHPEWPQQDITFNEEILDAASAIAIHNFEWGSNDEKINITDKIPYLLVLSDMIQEWDRFSPDKMMLPPTGVDIQFNENNIRIYLALDDQRIKKIQSELDRKIKNDEQLKVLFLPFTSNTPK
jgi:hypothetical protein